MKYLDALIGHDGFPGPGSVNVGGVDLRQRRGIRVRNLRDRDVGRLAVAIETKPPERAGPDEGDASGRI
jgi:hypothetical protein